MVCGGLWSFKACNIWSVVIWGLKRLVCGNFRLLTFGLQSFVIFPIDGINWSEIIQVINFFIITHLLRMAMFHSLREQAIVTISLYTISNWQPTASWRIWPLRIQCLSTWVVTFITVKFRYRADVDSAYGSCTVLLKCPFATPFPVCLYTVPGNKPMADYIFWQSEYVMVNDLCNRPVINMPIMQVPGVGRLPCTFDVLICCCVLACLGFEKLFHELFCSVSILT